MSDSVVVVSTKRDDSKAVPITDPTPSKNSSSTEPKVSPAKGSPAQFCTPSVQTGSSTSRMMQEMNVIQHRRQVHEFNRDDSASST